MSAYGIIDFIQSIGIIDFKQPIEECYAELSSGGLECLLNHYDLPLNHLLFRSIK